MSSGHWLVAGRIATQQLFKYLQCIHTTMDLNFLSVAMTTTPCT